MRPASTSSRLRPALPTLNTRRGSFRALMHGLGSSLDISGTANRQFLRSTQTRTDSEALRGDMIRVGHDYRSAVRRIAEESSSQQREALARARVTASREIAQEQKRAIEALSQRTSEAVLSAFARAQQHNAQARSPLG